jgi:hypothetical protein
MKRLLAILAFTSVLGVYAQAPGFNLRFSRVIDTVLVAEINSCVLVNTGIFGTSVTVPPGRVWKVSAIGPLRTLGLGSSSFWAAACNYNSGSMGALAGTEIVDGGPINEFISSIEFVNSSTTNRFSTEGTVWLREGTVVRAAIYPRVISGSQWYSVPASPSSLFRVSQFLSILEFQLQP